MIFLKVKMALNITVCRILDIKLQKFINSKNNFLLPAVTKHSHQMAL